MNHMMLLANKKSMALECWHICQAKLHGNDIYFPRLTGSNEGNSYDCSIVLPQ